MRVKSVLPAMAVWLGGGGGGGGGGVNLRTCAYLSVFSSLLVVIRWNTGLSPQPHRHRLPALVHRESCEIKIVAVALICVQECLDKDMFLQCQGKHEKHIHA